MKTQNKHKWILILMMMSQLLLICFALYWLNSQYKLEKNALLKEMYSYYQQSYNVTIDSMLVKNVIKPAMNDSINHYYNYGYHSGAIVMADSLKIVKGSMPFRKSNKDGKGIVTIRLDSSQDTSDVKSFNAESEGLDDDMLLRSVKLFVQLSNDSLGKHKEFLNGFGHRLDSALFVSDFESRLGEHNFNFSPIWTTASVDTEEPGNERKYYEAVEVK